MCTIDGPDRVNHVSGYKFTRLCDHRFTSGKALGISRSPYLATLFKNSWTTRAMYRSIDATAAQQ